jgi:hypothetical protein
MMRMMRATAMHRMSLRPPYRQRPRFHAHRSLLPSMSRDAKPACLQRGMIVCRSRCTHQAVSARKAARTVRLA